MRNIQIIRDEQFVRALRGSEIKANPRLRNAIALYKNKDSNRHIAIHLRNGKHAEGISSVTIVENHKVPVYKQAMAMQMGKIPRTNEVRPLRTARVERISIDEAGDFVFEIYRVY